MFDPEKVARFYDATDTNGDRYMASADYAVEPLCTKISDWVLASDYDELLKLYRDIKWRMDGLEK